MKVITKKTHTAISFFDLLKNIIAGLVNKEIQNKFNQKAHMIEVMIKISS